MGVRKTFFMVCKQFSEPSFYILYPHYYLSTLLAVHKIFKKPSSRIAKMDVQLQLYLVRPRLCPSCPELGGGILLAEVLELGVAGDVDARDQINLKKEKN